MGLTKPGRCDPGKATAKCRAELALPMRTATMCLSGRTRESGVRRAELTAEVLSEWGHDSSGLEDGNALGTDGGDSAQRCACVRCPCAVQGDAAQRNNFIFYFATTFSSRETI